MVKRFVISFTWVRKHINVSCVWRSFWKLGACCATKLHTLLKNHMSVTFVIEGFQERHISRHIFELTQEKSPTDVWNVVRFSQLVLHLVGTHKHIFTLTLKKIPTGVRYVVKFSQQIQHFMVILEYIQYGVFKVDLSFRIIFLCTKLMNYRLFTCIYRQSKDISTTAQDWIKVLKVINSLTPVQTYLNFKIFIFFSLHFVKYQ
jgi:hypothetical protein